MTNCHSPANSANDAETKPHEAIYKVYYTILYYTILYYTILYYTILYYTILYYTILYYTILYYTILYYTMLCYTILCYTILYYTILYYTILYYTILYYTILYYTILYCTVLYYTILYYTILQRLQVPKHAELSLPLFLAFQASECCLAVRRRRLGLSRSYRTNETTSTTHLGRPTFHTNTRLQPAKSTSTDSPEPEAAPSSSLTFGEAGFGR